MGVASLSGRCSVSCVQDNGSFGDRAIIFFYFSVVVWLPFESLSGCLNTATVWESIMKNCQMWKLPVFPVADMMQICNCRSQNL